MHRHKTVAQILIILSILNNTFAAPAVSVRETRELHDAMAARAPVGGAMLWKRPEQNGQIPGTSSNPFVDPSAESNGHHVPTSPNPFDTVPGTSALSNGHSGTSSNPFDMISGTSALSNGHVSVNGAQTTGVGSSMPSPETSPRPSTEIIPHETPNPELHPQTSTSEIRPEPQATNSHPEQVGTSSGASSVQGGDHAPSPPKKSWRPPKIMTPEKIKATKYTAAAALFTSLYLTLALPEYLNLNNGNQNGDQNGNKNGNKKQG